jgi:16S rRNA (cytosine1402-N4)-methyltransferase
VSVYHTPVMLAECLEYLNLPIGGIVVDGTLGGAGHAQELSRIVGPSGIVVGLDRDPDALSEAEKALGEAPSQIRLVRSNFSEISSALDSLGIPTADGVLLDLGVSSHQLDTPGRGFAFRLHGPLDMRMSPDEGESAAALIDRLSEAELTKILFEYGEESRARRIAAEIVKARPLKTTEDLVDCIRRAMPFGTRPGQAHPATKTFQALRIAVNGELEILERALRESVARLKPGGRLVVMSYHSLEDRIVKTVFNELSGKREGSDFPDIAPPVVSVKIITKKPVAAGEEELRRNPRSRSAKLRAVEKVEGGVRG